MPDFAMSRRDFLKGLGLSMVISTFPMPSESEAEAGSDMSQSIPVLMYHGISTCNGSEYMLTASVFAAQMEWLYEQGYKTIWFSDIDKGNIPANSIILTFDDGHASYVDFALPLLEGYGFKSTMNVIGEFTGTFIPDNTGNMPILSWDEYRYLVKTGLVELGCHSDRLHHFATEGALGVSPETLLADLLNFQKTIRQEVGVRTNVLAWPYGFYSGQTIEVAQKAGFKYLLTSKYGYMPKGGPFNEVPRLNIGCALEFPRFQYRIEGDV